jgi:hypothetical protein
MNTEAKVYAAPTEAEIQASPFSKPQPPIQSMADVVVLLERILSVLKRHGIDPWCLGDTSETEWEQPLNVDTRSAGEKIRAWEAHRISRINLKESERAIAYLKSLGIMGTAAATLGIGYDPAADCLVLPSIHRLPKGNWPSLNEHIPFN